MNSWVKIFLLLVAYLPFQVALNLSPDKDVLSGRLLILGLFAAFVGWRFFHGQLSFRGLLGRRVALALATFLLLAALSVVVAANPVWGGRKLLVFISIFPLFWLAIELIKNEITARRLVWVVVLGAGGAALIALGQFLAQFIFGQEALINFWAVKVTPTFSGASFGALVASNPSWQVAVSGRTLMRAIGLFPDPHMLSYYLGLTLPFSMALFVFEKRWRFLLFILNCLLFVVLLLTFSRGGYLGLMAALGAFGVFGWPKFSPAAKKFFGATLLFGAAFSLFVGAPVLGRLVSSFDLAEGSNLGRLAIWQDSWAVIKSSPLLGVGLGNYPAAVDFNGAYRSAVTSHNLYLDLWAEIGILGLAVWLALIGSAAQAAVAQLKRSPVWALGALAALAYFSVHSFFETPIFNPVILSILMVVLAMAGTAKKENVL